MIPLRKLINDYALFRFMSSQPTYQHSFLVSWSLIFVKISSPFFFNWELILVPALTSVDILSLI